MQIYKFPILLLCLFSLIVLPLLAQDSVNIPPAAPVSTQAPAQVPTAENPPPADIGNVPRPNFNPNATPTRTSTEKVTSIAVLVFGFAIVAALIWVIVKRMEIKQNSDLTEALKLPVVVTIIVAGVFLVTAGYGNQQIAPIVGLMGTIAGYLMGRNGK
ncbi:MAG: hypothetical protein AAF741_11610 [Bacteroidota bacterium]